jgi:hypothetical protein
VQFRMVPSVKHLNLKGIELDTPSRSAIAAALLFTRPVCHLDRQTAQDEVVYFRWTMPLLRYFTFVGGALLALLIVVSSYLPETEIITRPDAARPVIRIASDRVGPPRVNIDTRVQTAVVPASVPEILQQAPAQVAQAQLSAPLPTPAAPVKIERKKTRVAKRADRQRMAANPQGFQPFHLTW